MKYQDSFSASFAEQDAFLNFLDQVEESAAWRVYPTSELKVSALDEAEDTCREIEALEDGSDILADTRANTGLFLKVGEDSYPLGLTAVKSLENRA